MKRLPSPKRRLLVVDDESSLLAMLRRLFTRNGFEVFTARNVDQALALLDREPVDIVVTDMVMPGKDGLDLIEAVKAGRPDLPIILVTGYASENRIERARKNCAAHLAKPFRLDEILAAVRSALPSTPS